MKGSIGLAVVGLGDRSRCVMDSLRRIAGDHVRVAAAYDPDARRVAEFRSRWGESGFDGAASAEAAIRAPEADWTLVFSPNARHKEHILAAFDAGRHVFTEKPLATTLADCRAIHDGHRAHPELHFATGFVLRYAPIYRRAKELLASGSFGRLLSVDANENIAPDHGGYIVTNWRRRLADAGPHILEKCCHDLDLLNWFCSSLPARVASFGGRGMFVPENASLLERHGAPTFTAWNGPGHSASPFTLGHDLMDNQVAILEYRNGVRAQFQATLANAMPERRMYFSCTEGTMTLELYQRRLWYRRLGDEGVTVLEFDVLGHGGGDEQIARELYATMSDGVPPRCGADEGLESAVVALAIDEAARTGGVVNLEPTWRQLER